jgi:succinate dehydrogenase / fumarate reductase cytochrome b subunit
VAEFGLGTIFLIHFIYAIWVTIDKWIARPKRYTVVTNADHTSQKTIASTTMIYTGSALIIFLVWHLLHFKFGEMIMYTTSDGQVIRDLYTVVYQFYENVINVILYVVVLSLLGFHLSHGFWSAFQSLGINGKRFTPFVITLGIFFAIIMAVGFILLPVYIFIISGGAL